MSAALTSSLLLLPLLLQTAAAALLAPMNVQALSCLSPNHSLAANQGWVARPVALEAAAITAANLSCPLTERRCYSGSDILPAGRANMTLASCCDLCHSTSGCLGIVLTTRPGNSGLTCYLKSKLERSGGGSCTSGSLGHPFPSPPNPHPAPPAPRPTSPGPPSPAIGEPVQLIHNATGRCLESAQPSGNVVAAACKAGSTAQRFQFREDGTLANGVGHCLFIAADAHGVDANVVAANQSCTASTCGAAGACQKWMRGPGDSLVPAPLNNTSSSNA